MVWGLYSFSPLILQKKNPYVTTSYSLASHALISPKIIGLSTITNLEHQLYLA